MMNRTHARADRSAEGCVYVLGDGRVGGHVAARLAGDRAVHFLSRSLPEDLPHGATGEEVSSLDAETLAEADVDEAAAVVVAERNDAKNPLHSYPGPGSTSTGSSCS